MQNPFASNPWPTGFMFAAIGGLVLGVILPWALFSRRRPAMALLPPSIASLIWMIYEWRLSSSFPPGDPLIRIDLFLIIPLAAAAWLSAIVTFTAASRQNR